MSYISLPGICHNIVYMVSTNKIQPAAVLQTVSIVLDSANPL